MSINQNVYSPVLYIILDQPLSVKTALQCVSTNNDILSGYGRLENEVIPSRENRNVNGCQLFWLDLNNFPLPGPEHVELHTDEDVFLVLVVQPCQAPVEHIREQHERAHRDRRGH